MNIWRLEETRKLCSLGFSRCRTSLVESQFKLTQWPRRVGDRAGGPVRRWGPWYPGEPNRKRLECRAWQWKYRVWRWEIQLKPSWQVTREGHRHWVPLVPTFSDVIGLPWRTISPKGSQLIRLPTAKGYRQVPPQLAAIFQTLLLS